MNNEIKKLLEANPYPFFSEGQTNPDQISNLPDALELFAKQLREHQDFPKLQNEGRIFVLKTIVSAFRESAFDLSSDSMQKLYLFAHRFFEEQLYQNFSRNSVSPKQYDLFLWFLTIRDVEYEDFVCRFSIPVTVSLTSFPDRILYVSEALRTILDQTIHPRKILLWLAEEQFPGKESDLPENLIDLTASGTLQIRWCDDLRPHKKYFYALQEITSGAIITIDDDLLYPPDLIENLLLSYTRHPDCVSAIRTHFIPVNDDGQIPPYADWLKETDVFLDKPCMQVLATGGAGALYPADIFPTTLFNRQVITENCLDADDLWMKAMELLASVPVVTAAPDRPLRYIKDSQKTALWGHNKVNGNDEALQKIIIWMDNTYGKDTFLRCIKQEVDGFSQFGFKKSCDAFWSHVEILKKVQKEQNKQIDRLKKELEAEKKTNRSLKKKMNDIQQGYSYRISRMITWLPRKIKAVIKKKMRKQLHDK